MASPSSPHLGERYIVTVQSERLRFKVDARDNPNLDPPGAFNATL